MDKLCTDCKHSTPRYAGVRLCLHETNLVISRVDGVTEIARSCEGARDSANACGHGAVWFSPKDAK